MGRCMTIFVLSGVLLAGVGYILRDPDTWGQYIPVWLNIRSSFKPVLIFGEMKYRLGFADRLESIRSVAADIFKVPPSAEDRQQLEIYDTTLDGIPVRVYKPKSAKGLLPGLVFYHGGAWMLFDVPTYDGQCAYFARTLNMVVISVEYRLAPEFPFPAGFDDCFKATVHVLTKGKDVGVDTSKIVIGGDSAGGNFAAAISTKLRDDKVKPAVKAQLLIYGVYQFCEFDLPVWKEQVVEDPSLMQQYSFFLKFYFNLTDSQTGLLASTQFLTPEHQERCFKNVDYKLLPKELIPEGHQRSSRLAPVITEDVKVINSYLTDLRFAPMLADDVSNFPPTFVFAAGLDILRDEGIIYAERIRKTGTPVEIFYIPDTFHLIFNSIREEMGLVYGPQIMKEITKFVKKYIK